MKRWLPLLIGLAALLPMAPREAQACPGCKEAVVAPAEIGRRQAASRAFNLSVGVLLLVPLALVGMVTTVVVRSQRRARRRSG